MPTYLVVNAHGGGGTQDEAFARWLERINPDVALISETGEVRDNVDKLRGYKVLGPVRIPGFRSKGKRDCAIAIRENAAGRDYEVEQLTQDLGRPIAPDRWWAKALLNKRALYALHANAVIQDRKTGGWRTWVVATQWYLAMRKINRAFRRDQRAGHRVVAGGDMNWSVAREQGAVKGSPFWLARKRGLKYVGTQLMWFFWDDRYYTLADHEVIPGSSIPTGVGDTHPHPALLVTLEHRRG